MLGRRMGAAALLVWVGTLPACGPRVVVHAERSTIATFGRYDTYRWDARAMPARSPHETEASLLDWRTRNAVERGLAAKGYVETDGDASLLVGYDVVPPAQSTESFRDYFQYRRRSGSGDTGGSFARGYPAGTLVVFLVDARTRQLAYRASASEVVAEGGDPRRVDDAVARMLADLPHIMTPAAR